MFNSDVAEFSLGHYELTPLQDFTKSWIRIASKDRRGSLFTGDLFGFHRSSETL